MNRQDAARFLRDVLEHSDYSQCTAASDECSTNLPAMQLAELLHGPPNPDGFEMWHQRWYNPSTRLESPKKRRWWRR